MDRQIEISLGGREFVVHRARLGLYLSLQGVAIELDKAAKKQDSGAMAKALLSYLTLCLSKTDVPLGSLPWYELVSAFLQIVDMNTIEKEYAILKYPSQGEEVPWDYPDRIRITWVHLLASHYHWTKESIENLWPEEALGFIQEIIADEQVSREFAHSLSEVAYSYEKESGKSRYIPLLRPPWMVLKTDKQVMTKLYKGFLPAGKVIDIDGSVAEEIVH